MKLMDDHDHDRLSTKSYGKLQTLTCRGPTQHKGIGWTDEIVLMCPC